MAVDEQEGRLFGVRHPVSLAATSDSVVGVTVPTTGAA